MILYFSLSIIEEGSPSNASIDGIFWKENVKYLGVSDNKVYFEYVSGRIDYIPCNTVKEVLDSDGKIISVDCKLNENIPTEKSRTNLHKTDKQYYSRNDLIAAGNLLIDFNLLNLSLTFIRFVN